MSAGQVVDLLSLVTHARLISRDMFQARIQQGEEIHMHELLYPVFQAYDSVALHSDLTIIGSDQLFNEMLGRSYQEHFGQPPQVVITTKITPGIDGKAKQSKSLGNYIGLGHSPRDKFGRLMRLPDDLIVTYLRVYAEVSQDTIEQIEARVPTDPMACKLVLAREIVKRYHGAEVATREERWFLDTFSMRQIPADIPEVIVERGPHTAFALVRHCVDSCTSNSEVRRRFQQGTIKLNDQRIQPDVVVRVRNGDVIRAGRRIWFRIRIQE
jgi:tyrosyl-tRNA synthetase